MDALRPADDLLAADEHVEGVGVVAIIQARHRVEGANLAGEDVNAAQPQASRATQRVTRLLHACILVR